MDFRQTLSSRILRGGGKVLLVRVLGAILLFAMHLIMGRRIGAEGYGIYSFAVMSAGLMGRSAALGWPRAAVRFISQYAQERKWDLLRGVVDFGFRVALVGGFTAAGLVASCGMLLGLDPELALALLLGALLTPLTALMGVRRGFLQGLRQSIASVVPDEVVLPVLVVLGVWVVVPEDGAMAVLVHASAAAMVLLLSGGWLVRSLPPQSRRARPRFRRRYWFRTALPMGLSGLAFILLNRTDIVMLGALAEMKEVGVYSASIRFVTLMTFVLGSIEIVCTPLLSASFYGGRMEDFFATLRSARRWGGWMALPLLGVLLLFPAELLSLFGEDFSYGANLVRTLAAAQFVNVMTGPVGQALLMTGQQRLTAWMTGVAALVNVVGNVLAIPIWGALGAASVTAISVSSLNLAMLWYVTRKLEGPVPVRSET